MFKKMLASLISGAMLALSSSMLPADALNTQPQEMTESEALAQVCAELGITDFDAYVAELAARMQSGADGDSTRDTCPFDPAYYIDIYTGGSSNGRIDAMDANYLLQFLTGQVNYPYVYNDLDPTHDYIIDRADVQALLDCFSMVWIMEVYPDFVPGTHGATRTVDTGFENRSYWKYYFNTHTVSNSTYTLSLPSNMLNSAPLNPYIESNPKPMRTYSQSFDDRVVKVYTNDGRYGTGFIVDEHVIATNAHEVYQYISNPATGKPQASQFFISSVKAYKYNNSGQQSSQNLHIQSVHVPNYYINRRDANDEALFDYALIYVTENLITDLDYCTYNMGMFIEGVPNYILNGTTNTIVEFTGFPGDSQYTNSPSSSQGYLFSYSEYRFNAIMQANSGDSGSPCYIENQYNNQMYQTVFGIINSHGSWGGGAKHLDMESSFHVRFFSFF